MTNNYSAFRAIALGAIVSITPAAAFAARGNDSPGSDAGGGGCNCEGGDSPSSSRNDNSSGGRASQSITCGVEKIDGTNGAIYYAVSNNVTEPANNRTTVAVVDRNGTVATTEGNRDWTTLQPHNNETLLQCANRAMGRLYNVPSLAEQDVGIVTINEGAKAHQHLKR